MKTGNNKSTNNFILRLWSKKHYGSKQTLEKNMYSGFVTDVKSKETLAFNTPGQLMSILEKLYKKAEIKKIK